MIYSLSMSFILTNGYQLRSPQPPTVGILDFAANPQDFSISTVGDEQDMEGATDPSNGMIFGSQRWEKV
jgi:hypothetical protein